MYINRGDIMIKLIASDLDGTFLTPEKEVTAQNRKILEKCAKKNIMFVPATGRTLNAVPEYVLTLPSVKYIMTSNGAAVYEYPSMKQIIDECLNSETAQFIYEELKKHKVMLELFSKGRAYTSKYFATHLSEYGVFGQHAYYIQSTRVKVDSLDKIFYENINSIENINIIFPDISLRPKLKKIFSDKAFITTSSPNNMEISSVKATKGNSLKKLCSILSIKKEETIAFGDSENDIDMIMFSGCGVIMENADDKLKKKANYMAKSCSESGFADFLQNYI
jgi:Cof subfamily protein (haloacid dehalogenase superfamily)